MRKQFLALFISAVAARDTVNFDFAWRHQLGQSRRTSALLPSPSPAPGSDPPESQPAFEDATWQLIDAPHDMLIHQKLDPSASNNMGYYQRNVGWYRKHFSLPAAWEGSSVWIYFEGVFHETTWWLNGHRIRTHMQGYTAFSLRLDNVPGVEFGASSKNVLSVFTNASTGTGWWYEGAGLSRHNWLVRASPVHIEQDGAWVYTSQNKAGGATFHASVAVVSDRQQSAATPASSVFVRTTVRDTAGSTVATATSSSYTLPLSAPIPVNASATSVSKWTIQSPHLYTVAVELHSTSDAHISEGSTLIDSISITTGVRTVRFDADQGLYLNGVHVKMRGFCDHSSFAGVGAAVPDRVQLFRAQALRSVGGNAWRMAHNPPAVARLDYMDALGMLALDENRDYGGNRGQGGYTPETVEDELGDMRDLIKRDRSHPSVIWWSTCNEVGCRNESAAEAFRAISKLWDPTRAVTQNHLGTDTSTKWLDVQGFSHQKAEAFDQFHVKHPSVPMAATECCSCMSQRGVDEDVCPHPHDGGCTDGPHVAPGTFYNNNIGTCTAEQVAISDTRDAVAGTFIWSGFDYLGEARGWPQNTKCRGTVSDVAGFEKETSHWIRSVWLSNVSAADPGRPNDAPGARGNTHTTFIIESWLPLVGVTPGGNRSIHVYSNAASVRLELNGNEVGTAVVPHYYAMASFSVKYVPGTLTAISIDAAGQPVGSSHSVSTPGAVVAVLITLDAPSAATGTGTALVADGEDSAMIRATLVDASGRAVPYSDNNVTFRVASGPGLLWTTHNGDPANTHANDDTWTKAYHGLARAIIRTTADHATPAEHRRLLRAIDLEGNRSAITIVDPDAAAKPLANIVVEAVVVLPSGAIAGTISIPVTADLAHLPMAVARKY